MTDQPTWLGIAEEDLTHGIQERLGSYATGASVNACAREISNLSEPLRRDFQSYWETGSVDMNLAAGSWSIGKLIEDREMSIIGAYITLDWIIREPVRAEAALKKGYYTFTPLTPEAREKADLARRGLF